MSGAQDASKAENASKALDDISDKMINQIKSAEREFEADMAGFVEKKLGSFLGPGIGMYTQLFVALGVESRKQLDEEVKSLYKHSSVCDAYESLLEAEHTWDTFLKKVDQALLSDKSVKMIKEGDQVPNDISLVNARTGADCRVSDLWSEGPGQFVHLILLRHFA